jgi:hypothetical protein
MATSAPSSAWTSITRSGVRYTLPPSTIERRRTPSSSTAARSDMLNTW